MDGVDVAQRSRSPIGLPRVPELLKKVSERFRV